MSSENEQKKLKDLEEEIRSIPPVQPGFIYRVKINLTIMRHFLFKYPGYFVREMNKRLSAFRNYLGLKKGVRVATASVVILALLITGTAGLAYAADPAAPGDNLYGVDRGFENAEILFYTTKVGKAYKFILLAKERVKELETLYKENRLASQNIKYLDGEYQNHLTDFRNILKMEKVNPQDYIKMKNYLIELSTWQKKIIDEVSKDFPEIKNSFGVRLEN